MLPFSPVYKSSHCKLSPSFTMRFCLCALITFFLPTSASSSPQIAPPDASGKYTLHAGNLSASFIPYAASITNLFLPDRNGTLRDVVLGYDNASTYASDPLHPNYGAIPGRYANRIPNATYALHDHTFHTQRNNGNGTIHSGTNGWSYRFWNVTSLSTSCIVFSLRDEANSSMGFPGLVLARVTYTLSESQLRIRIEAEAPTHETPLMATSHIYWNLDAFANPAGPGTVLNHTLSIPGARRLIQYGPFVTDDSEPDGNLPEIPAGIINDFWSSPKPIGANASSTAWIGNCGKDLPGYDCGWTLDRAITNSSRNWLEDLSEAEFDATFLRTPIASLSSGWSGIRWDMYSNQAGLAMTSCGFFPEGELALPVKRTQGGMGSGNRGVVPKSGCVAVEPQDWMAGIDFLEWGRGREQVWGPSKGKYVNEIVYRFGVL